jgi:rhodanese-related sulfurtransferase
MIEHLPLEAPPADVKRRLDSGESLFLVDVRQPEEFQITRIPGAELIPMNSIPAALRELKEKAEGGTMVVFCHHGMRSLNVVNWLRGQGISACQSMSGGIDQWSTDVDVSVPRY